MTTNTYTLIDEMLASEIEPMPLEDRRHYLTRMWQGLNAMLSPGAKEEDWGVCRDAVVMMEILVSVMGECMDDSGRIDAAIQALKRARNGHESGLKYRVTETDAQIVRGILEDYATVLESLPHRKMIRCHRLAEKSANARKPAHSKKTKRPKHSKLVAQPAMVRAAVLYQHKTI